MKRILTLLYLVASSVSAVFCQTLKVADFHIDPSDITAQAEQVSDLNGEPCALVKVSLSVPAAVFEGDIIKQEEKGKSEYYVYLVDGSNYLTVKTDDYPVLRYDFPENVKGNNTYVLDIIRPGENPAKRTITLKFDDGTGEQIFKLDMILCKAGRFEMGDTPEQNSNESDAKAHWVRLSKDYYIGETEVTQDLWEFVMGVDANQSIIKGAKHPVDNISWNQAQDFIAGINKMITLGNFRMPTEAEWEYAARGAHKMTRTRFAGSDDPGEVGWYYDNSPQGSHKVKEKKPNEIGIYDMSGNVWELCSDFKEDFDDKEVTDPKGPATAKRHVRRGGAYDTNDNMLRVAYRHRATADRVEPSVGLRLVWTR